jgi:hypothetical protein
VNLHPPENCIGSHSKSFREEFSIVQISKFSPSCCPCGGRSIPLNHLQERGRIRTKLFKTTVTQASHRSRAASVPHLKQYRRTISRCETPQSPRSQNKRTIDRQIEVAELCHVEGNLGTMQSSEKSRKSTYDPDAAATSADGLIGAVMSVASQAGLLEDLRQSWGLPRNLFDGGRDPSKVGLGGEDHHRSTLRQQKRSPKWHSCFRTLVVRHRMRSRNEN